MTDDAKNRLEFEQPSQNVSIEELWQREKDLDLLSDAYLKLQTDGEAAINDLATLSRQGSIAAKWYLGDAYYSGKFVTKNLSMSSQWFMELADEGVPFAFLMLGRIDVERGDAASAAKWYERGANVGYLPCVYRQGELLCENQAHDKRELGKRLVETAIERGSLPARRGLGILYLKGQFGWIKFGYGLYLLLSLVGILIWMTFSGGHKISEFDERVVA